MLKYFSRAQGLGLCQHFTLACIHMPLAAPVLQAAAVQHHSARHGRAPQLHPHLFQSDQNTSNGPGENPPGCPCTQLMAFMDGIQILCLHPTGHFHPALSHLQEELTRLDLHVYTFPNVEVLFKSSRPGALPALHTGMHSHAPCSPSAPSCCSATPLS